MSTVDAEYVEPLNERFRVPSDKSGGIVCRVSWPPAIATMIEPDLARQELQDRKGRPVAPTEDLVELLWRHYSQACELSTELRRWAEESGDLKTVLETREGLDRLSRQITSHVKTHQEVSYSGGKEG